ncbi:LOW QUALITY PROTEIN: hypothetical protein CFOL_v3_20864, partial [Cephalotus follicularis]
LIRQIKNYAKEIPCLHLASPLAFKGVETDGSDIRYGGILKQLIDNKEQLVQYTSGTCNNAQRNYATIKKEILAIVLCVKKFQSDLKTTMASKPKNTFKTKQSYSQTSHNTRLLPQTITTIPNEKSLIPVPAKPLTTIYANIVKGEKPTSSQAIITQKYNKPTNKHIQGDYSEFLLTIELEFQRNCQTPLEIAQRVFHNGWNFDSTHPFKTQIFYEYILVDTDSIKISLKTDLKNPFLTTHTSVSKKIITIPEWGQSPHSYRYFSSSFDPPTYNYFDYMDAAFLFQNIENKHSWFFCFDKTFNNNKILPYWFIDWWLFYGPHDAILPNSITDALVTFSNHIEKNPLCPTIITFFIHCRLSWIMYWDYSICQPTPNHLPALYNFFLTKWWNNY